MNIDNRTALVANFLHAISERERRHDHPDALLQFKSAYQQLLHAAHSSPLPFSPLPPPSMPIESVGRSNAVESEGTSLTPGPSPGGRGEKEIAPSPGRTGEKEIGPSPGGRGENDRFLRELTDGFTYADSNWAFGSIANMCGVLVEQGGDPTIALEPILDRLTLQLARVPEWVGIMQQHLGVERPNQVAPGDWPTLGKAHPDHAWVIGEWFALNFVGGAAMTMLCRNMQARIQARQRHDLVRVAESSRSEQPYAYYLAELLGMADDDRLLVLDTTRAAGYRIRLSAVRNNFHLFTLLQGAFPENDSRSNPLALSIARSERMLSDVSSSEWEQFGEHDAARWSFNAWRAANPGEPRWIWGEMKPTEIPMLEGERIVVLGPLDTPRSWEIAFFAPLHSALRSGISIEDSLSPPEYESWLERIRSNARHS